ncbi:hypothetical protein BerOc1_01787 [Pseudodesulfovibrio hydrargyri]|uniref:Uncharacterized protein n=1 Tax=Pseudodesulfovibrio hydrargyri TaxID=2125990 RepID=A0A1J5N2M3_9BACT|nr:hypothetical protein BerOc1_01787 [Pseudodesulfovibrio hydrargyri]
MPPAAPSGRPGRCPGPGREQSPLHPHIRFAQKHASAKGWQGMPSAVPVGDFGQGERMGRRAFSHKIARRYPCPKSRFSFREGNSPVRNAFSPQFENAAKPFYRVSTTPACGVGYRPEGFAPGGPPRPVDIRREPFGTPPTPNSHKTNGHPASHLRRRRHKKFGRVQGTLFKGFPGGVRGSAPAAGGTPFAPGEGLPEA